GRSIIVQYYQFAWTAEQQGRAMMSLYRIFGGIGLLLIGAYLLPITLPSAFKWITGVCLAQHGASVTGTDCNGAAHFLPLARACWRVSGRALRRRDWPFRAGLWRHSHQPGADDRAAPLHALGGS